MRRRPWRLPALLLVVAIVATGCQIPAAWSALLGGPESRPIASPAAPAPTPGSPLVFERATIDDPDLVLSLPVKWATIPLDMYRGLLVSLRDNAPAKQQALYAYHLKELDSGAARLVASGPSGFAPWTGTIVFEVDSGDATLDAAVARVDKLAAAISPASSRDQHHVTFGFGEGERIVTTHPVSSDAPAGSVPARSIDYVILLDDGRTLVIQASGPEASEGFATLIDDSVSTIARR